VIFSNYKLQSLFSRLLKIALWYKKDFNQVFRICDDDLGHENEKIKIREKILLHSSIFYIFFTSGVLEFFQ